MASTKAAVARHINPAEPVVDCPLLDREAERALKASVQTANDFSMTVLGWLRRKTPEEQAAWLTATTEAGRALFQPWCTEILFVLATLGRSRFTELQNLLGVSSRTLSDKLRALREAGFVEREVFDEQPVRIEYHLTKRGRTTAALASPLIAQLNQFGQE